MQVLQKQESCLTGLRACSEDQNNFSKFTLWFTVL